MSPFLCPLFSPPNVTKKQPGAGEANLLRLARIQVAGLVSPSRV